MKTTKYVQDLKAKSVAELKEELQTRAAKTVYLIGDGAALVFQSLHEALPCLRLLPEHLRQQRAGGVALAAWAAVCRGQSPAAGDVSPNYLRLSQAERERLNKQELENK